jgi:hypothetical protein
MRRTLRLGARHRSWTPGVARHLDRDAAALVIAVAHAHVVGATGSARGLEPSPVTGGLVYEVRDCVATRRAERGHGRGVSVYRARDDELHKGADALSRPSSGRQPKDSRGSRLTYPQVGGSSAATLTYRFLNRVSQVRTVG